LLDLCGMTDTLIGDSDGIYHPALFNDRLLLGLKGTMSEAELYIIRARLDGGIRNKAARGELRRGLPVGFVWGEKDGEVGFHPVESVLSTIHTVFSKFTELGSARKVWLWFRSEVFPFRRERPGTARSVGPRPRTRPSLACSLIRCMLALMPMESVVMNVTWMNKACSGNEPGICPWPNARFFFPNTIPGTLIGRPFKPIKPASITMFIHNPIRQEVL
jgi:hypothetical protein